jgi:hypothetical protein
MLDKENYSLGDEVSAGIFLVVVKPVFLNSLDARIYGVKYGIVQKPYSRFGYPYHGPHSETQLIFERSMRFIENDSLEPGKYAWEISAKLPEKPDPNELKKHGIDIFYHAEAYANIPMALDVRAEKKIELVHEEKDKY